MKSAIAKCALPLMAVTGWTEPALARSYLNCLTKKVVIVDALALKRPSVRPLASLLSEVLRKRVVLDRCP